MYGVIPKCRDFDTREQKLKEIQQQNRESINLKEKYDELCKSYEEVRKELSLLSQSIDVIQRDLFGEKVEEYDDEETVEKKESMGYIHNFRKRIDQQREEYYDLVEKYMNELDRKRLEEIESRIVKLEEKPKINIMSSKQTIPEIEIEKKFTRTHTD